MQQIFIVLWTFLSACVMIALIMKFIASEQPLLSEHPLTYSAEVDRQLFVFVSLKIAIHNFVLGDNLCIV